MTTTMMPERNYAIYGKNKWKKHIGHLHHIWNPTKTRIYGFFTHCLLMIMILNIFEYNFSSTNDLFITHIKENKFLEKTENTRNFYLYIRFICKEDEQQHMKTLNKTHSVLLSGSIASKNNDICVDKYTKITCIENVRIICMEIEKLQLW
eukprot:UN12739